MERLIGYGYTNSSGIATLDYDANGTAISPSGYTGTGGGEIDIKAKLHDDNTVQSEPYTVDDCSYLDTFSSDTKNKYYYENGSVNISDGALTFTSLQLTS